MTQRLNDPSHLQARETTRDQLAAMRAAHRGRLAYDTPDPADVNYSFVPGRLLWSQQDDPEVQAVLTDRRAQDLNRIGSLQQDDTVEPISNVVVNRLTARRRRRGVVVDRKREGHGDPALEAMLAIFDDELGEGVVTPDHYLHVANGDGRHCPATEPEETGLAGPWPPHVNPAHAQDGRNVRVAVVDTGWHSRAGDLEVTKYLKADVDGEAEPYVANQRLRLYQGHGTFIAGVIKCRAPQAQITHYRIGDGIAVSETEMVAAIYRALAHPAGPPHIINLSAGCHTRHGIGPLTFRRLWLDTLSTMPETVLIAAAGNDGSDLPFYPAARGWAIGVGSLDHRGVGPVSSFSNYGDSADVYLLGRNHVNAFPDGTYVCKEAPNKRDVRVFANGLARWSGTSFAAPLFAGMVAARLGPTPGTRATKVAWDLVTNASQRQDPVHGWHRYIRVKDGDWLTNTY